MCDLCGCVSRWLHEFSEIWDLMKHLVSKTKLECSQPTRLLIDISLQCMTSVGVEAIQFQALPLLVAVLQMIEIMIVIRYLSRSTAIIHGIVDIL